MKPARLDEEVERRRFPRRARFAVARLRHLAPLHALAGGHCI